MAQETYLLIFNGEVLFAFTTLSVAHGAMVNRCVWEKNTAPAGYATVRRSILAEGKYIHQPKPGWVYVITTRQLIRKPIQRRLALGQGAEAKQSS